MGRVFLRQKYWANGPGSGDFRYTTTDDAFYIHVLSQSSMKRATVVPDLVPYLNGDKVTVVGGRMHGVVVDTSIDQDDRLVLHLSRDIVMADQYAWTFKIEY